MVNEVETYKGIRLFAVPCPYCGVKLGHSGTCELSVVRTGKIFRVAAFELLPKEQK